jgi:hypothetical protein
MRLLVCGMHRSGNSALAHLLCRATGMTLYDDPAWAQSPPHVVLNSREMRCELDLVDVLKCPRMAGYLDRVLTTFGGIRVLWVHRDLRDIFASIKERVSNAPNTSLLNFSEIGLANEGLEALCLASKIYGEVLFDCLSRFPAAIRIIKYEEFFARKEETIAGVADWLKLTCDLNKISASLGTQWGPVRHKFEDIRGPGRYLTDLTSYELDHLMEATWKWDSIVEFNGSTANRRNGAD